MKTCPKGIFLAFAGITGLEANTEHIRVCLTDRLALLSWLHDHCRGVKFVGQDMANKLTARLQADQGMLRRYATLFSEHEDRGGGLQNSALSAVALWTACALDDALRPWMESGETLLATWRAWPVVDTTLLGQPSRRARELLHSALQQATGVHPISRADTTADPTLREKVQAWTSNQTQAYGPEESLLPYRAPPETLEGLWFLPWTAAPRLVARRRCLLYRGNIIIASDLFAVLVRHVFPTWLRSRLDPFYRHIEGMFSRQFREMGRGKRSRLDELVHEWVALARRSVANAARLGSGAAVGGPGGVAKTGRAADKAGVYPFERHPAFTSEVPLCMGQMQVWMLRNGTLKYEGRLQYGLFLGDVGLSAQAACAHVATVAGRRASDLPLERRFGQIAQTELSRLLAGGKRYSAHSCRTIQGRGTTCSPSGAHGCPWTGASTDAGLAHLRHLLLSSGHSKASADALVARRAAQHDSASGLCRADCSARGAPRGAKLNSLVGVFPAWFSIALHQSKQENK